MVFDRAARERGTGQGISSTADLAKVYHIVYSYISTKNLHAYINILRYIFMIIKGDPSATSKVRVDGKCGASFPLSDGSPAECNVASNDYCCSEWGFCGSTDLHCTCEKCVNYRTLERDGNYSNYSNILEHMMP